MSGKEIKEFLLSPALSPAVASITAAFGPLGAICGALHATAAGKHHQEQVERTLLRIRSDLAGLANQLEELREPQLKLVMETLRTITETMNEEKQEYLARAVSNCVQHGNYSDYQATLLGRLIRDISADEILLLSQGVRTKGFLTTSRRGPGQEHYTVVIVSDLQDYDQIHSLVNMRLLEQDSASEAAYDHGSVFKPTKWAFKLLGLLGALEEKQDTAA